MPEIREGDVVEAGWETTEPQVGVVMCSRPQCSEEPQGESVLVRWETGEIKEVRKDELIRWRKKS